jgi:hypothetical protein
MKPTPLTAQLRTALLQTLHSRFDKNMHRHKSLDWSKIQSKLEASPEKLLSLHAMESTGGEPDVIALDKKNGQYLFVDCAEESPKGRRSLCYDPEALASRKENKPKDSALGLAAAMGIDLLTEDDYRTLQELDPVDLNTSSWLKTPPAIRELGGALFGDRRYNTVFLYHNGAESYYAARGFRGLLRV